MNDWPEAKPASAPGKKPASAPPDGAPAPQRAGATVPFPIAMMLMVGVSFGAVLGLVGWPMLQALGMVSPPVIEVVQRNQAELMSRLDATVHVLDAAVSQLSARVDAVGDRQESVNQFMTDIDAAFIALRKSMNELRDAQSAAKDSWLQPVAELNAAATKARGDIARLRASVDELSRLRQPDAAAIGARVDRIERALVQHELLGTIRGSIDAPGPRSVAARETSSAADGHIINLTPAR